MAALLVALTVMSIMLTVVMPVWKQTAQREKESELVFRGEQYARAIGMFQRRAGPGALPPNLDVLVEQRFLRKKYKDPITGQDFQPLLAGQAQPGTPSNPTVPPAAGGGRGIQPVAGGQPAAGPGGIAGAVGGIQGVVSKSKEKSLRLYKGRGVYSEWAFVFVPQQQAAGGAGGGQDGRGRGGRGGPGTSPGPGPGPGFPPGSGDPRGGRGGRGGFGPSGGFGSSGPFNPSQGGQPPIGPSGQPSPGGRR